MSLIYNNLSLILLENFYIMNHTDNTLKIFILSLILLAGTFAASAQNMPHRVATRSMQDGMEKFGKNSAKFRNIQVEGCPFLALQGGASLCYGEFARLRANLGGMSGFTLLGGVGKEMIFNREFKKKMTWHAGLGYYFAESPAWVVNMELVAAKAPSIDNVGILVQGEFDYFFKPYRRFGVFAGFGAGFGDLDKDDIKTLWEVSIGISFKLFQH